MNSLFTIGSTSSHGSGNQLQTLRPPTPAEEGQGTLNLSDEAPLISLFDPAARDSPSSSGSESELSQDSEDRRSNERRRRREDDSLFRSLRRALRREGNGDHDSKSLNGRLPEKYQLSALPRTAAGNQKWFAESENIIVVAWPTRDEAY